MQFALIHNLFAALFTIILVYSQLLARRHDPTQTRNPTILVEPLAQIVAPDEKSRE
jgi:hypothetical protein